MLTTGPRVVRRLVTVLALTTLMASAAADPASAATVEGIPHFTHVVVLTLENESASTTFAPGSPATYLNSLKAKGVFTPNYYGTGHVSLDNYIAMVSGQQGNPSTYSDCLGISLYDCVQTTNVPSTSPGRSLADQLEEARLSWRQYSDGGTPAAPIGDCFHSPYSATDQSPDLYQGDSRTAPAYDYADRHVPFLYFANIVGNPTRCQAHLKGYQSLAADLAGNALPAFSFITPDTCHDGHDTPCSDGSPGGLAGADAWLRTNVPPLLDYLAAHQGLLVINFDEGSPATTEPCSSCAGAGAGGRTGALFLSPLLAQGATVQTSYDHFSLLRTIEDSFGVTEHLNLANSANPMTEVFAGVPDPVVPEVPYPAILLVAGLLLLAVFLRRRSTQSVARRGVATAHRR